MKSVKSLLAMAVTVGLVTVGTSTYAIPTLLISDNAGDSILIADGSALDQSSAANVVQWSGQLGAWGLAVDLSKGTSSGSGISPNFDLESVEATIGGAAGNAPFVLHVQFGDINLGPTSGSFLAAINGHVTGLGSVNYNTYADLGNTLFGKSLALTSYSSGPLVGVLAPFSDSQTTGSEVLPFQYSLMQEVTITQVGPGGTDFSATLGDPSGGGPTVPEGGMTLVLLGSSLIALWAFGRFSKSLRA